MEPDKPAEKFTGSESVRSIGGFWVQCEGRGQMGDASDTGGIAVTVMTLGYHPQKGRFVGTWIGSMMSHLWIYDGSLDASEKVLTLNAEGPSFTAEGTLAGGQLSGKYDFSSGGA